MRTMLRIILFGLLCLPMLSLAGNPVSPIDFHEESYTTTGCPPFTVTILPDYWDDDDDVYISYEWDFGDGSTSTEMGPSHTYTTEGEYTVRLIMEKVSGIRDTVTKTAFIKAQNSFNVHLG